MVEGISPVINSSQLYNIMNNSQVAGMSSQYNDSTQASLSGAAQEIVNTGLIKRAQRATSDIERQKIKEEFLAIFYKEILKQTVKAPNLSLEESQDNANSFGSAFSNDILINQLALELAKTKSFSAATILPDDDIGGIGD